jgi:hypothetical protein
MNDGTMSSPPRREVGSETPEADAIEQGQAADPDDDVEEPLTMPEDASEADVLEQSRVVPGDDESYDR